MKKRISLFLTVVLLAIGGPVVWGQLQYLNRTPGSADTLPQMTDKLNYDLAYLLGLIGALGTNSGGTTVISNINVNNATITNLLVVNSLQASNAYIDNLTVTNGITNLSLTANTVLKADANKRISSIANGTGALTNNNAGLFGWMTFAGLNDLNSASNSIINQMGGVSNVFILNAANTATGASNTFNGDVFINGSLYINSTNPTTSISNLHVTGWAQIDGPQTNLSLTANTLLEANSGKGIASIANGTGALTNDGAGLFGWYSLSSLPVTTNFLSIYTTNLFATNIYAGDTYISNAYVNIISNVNKAYITNIYVTTADLTNIHTAQIDYNTNLCTMAPDFSKGYCWISTNAGFTFLAPLNLDYTKAQTTVQIVTNSLGSAIAATAPANVHVVPGSVMYVTNATAFTWFHYPLVGTNVYAVPLF